MLLSFKSERLCVRKKFKKCLARKADSVSKNLMGKDGLTGDLTGSPDGKEKIPKKRVKKFHKNNVLWNEWRE